MGLAGLVDSDMVAPTKLGLAVLQAVAAAGITPRPPHPSGAWIAFRTHIARVLPADLRMLILVLRAIAERPSPEDLVAQFVAEWGGSMAQTNVSGYVSRAREWGLIQPSLVDGRYTLTEHGRGELSQVFSGVAGE
jgi:hypothetical protein